MKTWVRLVVLCLTVLFITPAVSGLRAADKVDDAWLKQVAALPAEKQVEAVAKKLKELNPDFDGKVIAQDREGRGDGVAVSHGQCDGHLAGRGAGRAENAGL